MIKNLKLKIKNYNLGILALVLAALIWGAATPILKKSLETAPPFSMAFLRFIIALIFLIPLSARHGIALEKKHLPKIIKASFYGITLNIGLLFFGATLTTGLHIAIIIALVPIFTAIAAKFLLNEKLKTHTIIGIMFGFFGALIIIGEPILCITVGYKIQHVIGDLLVVLSCLAWVGYTIEYKELDKIKSYSPLETLPISFLTGAVSFLPLAIFELIKDPLWAQNLSNFSIFGILYYGIFSSLIAYILYNYGLAKTTATTAGISEYIIPIVSILLSIPILGEKITFYFTIGTILIAIGLFITELRLRKKM